MGLKHEVRRLLWQMGYDITRYTSQPVARRKKLLETYGIDVILDVGANAGQFAQQTRNEIGYNKRIVSFEPLSSAFERLKAKAKNDPQWEVFNFALGEAEAKREINIASNSYSSSLLRMLPSHIKALPASRYIGTEVVEIRTLDSILGAICSTDSHIYLKIDTQGYENRVLKGAEQSLAHVDTIQLEMSLVPLYEGELLFSDMYLLLSGKGYALVSIESGFSDQDSGQLLQVDGIFHRF